MPGPAGLERRAAAGGLLDGRGGAHRGLPGLLALPPAGARRHILGLPHGAAGAGGPVAHDGVQDLLLDTDLPERRMSFAVLHLVSALGFPVSFLCMVLTPDHRTLAELLSGLEILQMPSRRVR